MSASPLRLLSEASLRSLAASLRQGSLSHGITRSALEQLVGVQSPQAKALFEELATQGFSSQQTATLIDAVADDRAQSRVASDEVSLIMSGPEVPGVPTADTAAAVQTLIQAAASEILIVGYVVRKGRALFQRLADRMVANPDLRVSLILNIARSQNDTSLDSEIVRRFVMDFRKREWPGDALPAIYYDPRALTEKPADRASLHAKCVIVDRREAIVTSANFTEAAHHRNIEAGVILKSPALAVRLADYFNALIHAGALLCATR
ncbi:MAG TPA: DISARM system phospholipase D-like protein DrmC [Verrucomicrobiae bacterium]|nr:DISARM system phospholipase D-like protein DrmC [Verrucomicrobiae bacterium]